MSENFAELFAKSQTKQQLFPGAVVRGKVIGIDKESVIVNAGLKSEAYIPKEQFFDMDGKLSIREGDEVDVAIEMLEDGFGETRLSRERAKRMEVWRKLQVAHESGQRVMGVIASRVKGGYTVEFEGVRAFLPNSLLDHEQGRGDRDSFEGKSLEFKIIKIDQKRSNIVVSRRAIRDEETSADRQALLEGLREGQELKGVVKNILDYGAFIDLGGVDGLLHITDMSWERIKDPRDVLQVGQKIDVKVIKITRHDGENQRVSLGMKQLGSDPWVDVAARYPVGAKVSGEVSNITDYGCFVKLEYGVEGLVHVSEMDWVNKNANPSKLVQLHQKVEVKVLDIDGERRRISLGLKQCKANPWEAFATLHNKGDKIKGKIKSITDFGLFIGLTEGIDGLVHLSDLAWGEGSEEMLKQFKKGEEVEAVVLAIDAERERVSLGIKQLQFDPFANFVTENAKGAIVKGTVKAVEPKLVTLHLAEEVEGQIKASDLGKDRVDDASHVVKVGEEIEAKIVNVDKKNRTIQLSVRALHQDQEDQAMAEHAEKNEPIKATLGDLFQDRDS